MTLVPGANTRARPVRMALHQRLSFLDDRGGLHPQLVAQLPALDDGTWVVRADGTMRTVYRFRSGITWHDGTPLTVRDVLFGWAVTKDPELPVNQRGFALDIGRIETQDEATFVIEWTATNPMANAIGDEGIGPLPAHLLEAIYQSDKDRFQNSLYWSTEFVGLGPYRLTGWEPGNFMVLQAYEAFYGGRAKIDTLEFRFIPSTPTVVANLLADEIDGAIPPALEFEQAMFVKAEWERAGKTPAILTQPVTLRIAPAQFREPRPRDVLDVRFRRALLQLLDRQVLVDALAGGQSQVADSPVPPDDTKWSWVSEGVARYPYDQRRGGELLGELGWRPNADGRFVNAAGESLTISTAAAPGAEYEQLNNIMGALWRREGVAVDQTNLTPGQYQDNRTRSSFATFLLSELPVGSDQTLLRYRGSNCPIEETRWGGANWGCYQNPYLDSLIDGIRTTIDPAEQRRLDREFARVHSEDLPYLPLFFALDATVFRSGVTGARGESRPKTSSTWNVAEWDVN